MEKNINQLNDRVTEQLIFLFLLKLSVGMCIDHDNCLFASLYNFYSGN